MDEKQHMGCTHNWQVHSPMAAMVWLLHIAWAEVSLSGDASGILLTSRYGHAHAWRPACHDGQMLRPGAHLCQTSLQCQGVPEGMLGPTCPLMPRQSCSRVCVVCGSGVPHCQLQDHLLWKFWSHTWLSQEFPVLLLVASIAKSSLESAYFFQILTR